MAIIAVGPTGRENVKFSNCGNTVCWIGRDEVEVGKKMLEVEPPEVDGGRVFFFFPLHLAGFCRV